MHIETVTLTNFQCFGPEATVINLEPEVTALIGSNGTGKTAACQALLRLFGVTAEERTVRLRDFHIAASATGSGSSEDNTAAGDDESQGGDVEVAVDPQMTTGEGADSDTASGTVPERTLSIEVLLSFPELDDDDPEDTRAVPEFFHRMAAAEDGTLKCRIRLESRWQDDGTMDGAIETTCWVIPTLEPVYDQQLRVKLPASERGRIQVLYVPASRDGARHVTAFLRGRLWRAAHWSEELRDLVTTSADELRQAFHDEPATTAIETALTTRWAELYGAGTHATPRFQPLDADITTLLRGSELVFEPDHSGTHRPAQLLSDGQRSLLHLALTAATLDLEDEIVTGTAGTFDALSLRLPVLTVLAVEEPENSLSPFYLSRIVSQLLDLGASERAQSILASHSPSVLNRIYPGNVRYFRLDPTTGTGTVCPVTLPTGDAEASKYVREAVRAHPELYFARFVVLGEGATEELVIPRVAQARGIELDPSFVAVVPLGGRHTNHFWRLLNDLHIPHATLLDLDFGRAGAGPARLRNACRLLMDNGVDVLAGLDGIDSPDDIIDDIGVTAMTPILQHLRTFGVFFASPLDLDMAMLRRYPTAYKALDAHERGPGAGDATDAVLGSELTEAAASYWTPEDVEKLEEQQALLRWYRYLFLNRSKPSTHLRALTKLSRARLSSPPAFLRELVEHIQTELNL